jgi:hypothetical protein
MPNELEGNLGVPDSYDRSDPWPTYFSSTTTQP